MSKFKSIVSKLLPVAKTVAPVIGLFNRRAGIVATAIVAAGMAYAHEDDTPVGSTNSYNAESEPSVKVDPSRLESDLSYMRTNPDVIGERVYSGNGNLLGHIDNEGRFTHHLTDAQ